MQLYARLKFYGEVDPRGRVHFADVPATPDGRAWINGRRAHFVITAGETTAFEFPPALPQRATLTGVVEDPEGRALPGATVRLIHEHADSLNYTPEPVATDLEGRFEVRLAQAHVAESWVVVAAHARYAAGARRGLRLASGSSENVRIRLRRGLVLEGTVVDAAGRPCAGARLAMSAEPSDPRMWSHYEAPGNAAPGRTSLSPPARSAPLFDGRGLPAIFLRSATRSP